MKQPNLFDIAMPEPWQEVPQARFASWSDAEQLTYCAARDENAAARDYDPWWQQFYRDRAVGYRNDVAL